MFTNSVLCERKYLIFGANNVLFKRSNVLYEENNVIFKGSNVTHDENNVIFKRNSVTCEANNVTFNENNVTYKESNVTFNENNVIPTQITLLLTKITLFSMRKKFFKTELKLRVDHFLYGLPAVKQNSTVCWLCWLRLSAPRSWLCPTVSQALETAEPAIAATETVGAVLLRGRQKL